MHGALEQEVESQYSGACIANMDVESRVGHYVITRLDTVTTTDEQQR